MKGKSTLWVRSLEALEPKELPGTEGAAQPFWSPDSKSIGFFASQLSKVQRVDVAGGPVQTLINKIDVGRGGAWSNDGFILAGSNIAGLLRVSANGGAVSKLTEPDATLGEGGHSWPQILPNGRFLYLAWNANAPTNMTYGATIAKPRERTEVIAGPSTASYVPGFRGHPGYLVWLRDGRVLAQEFDPSTLQLRGEAMPIVENPKDAFQNRKLPLTFSNNGYLMQYPYGKQTQMTWLNREGIATQKAEPDNSWSIRLSPDSHRVAHMSPGERWFDIWLREWERGISERLTLEAGNRCCTIWSPDGNAILYSEGSSGSRSLYIREASGSDVVRRLTENTQSQSANDWSKDGKNVIYQEYTRAKNRYDLWILPMAGTGRLEAAGKPRLYLRTPFNVLYARFSPEPNPRWVAYVSDETGRREIYIQGFPEARNKRRVSIDGGSRPQWGRGGKELYYLSTDNKLMVVDMLLGGETVQPGIPRMLFPLPPITDILFGGASPYEAAADGNRFLVLAASQQSSPLTVIVNWHSLLKSKTSGQ